MDDTGTRGEALLGGRQFWVDMLGSDDLPMRPYFGRQSYGGSKAGGLMTNAEARIRALVNEAKRTEQWLYVEQADLRELLSELDRLRQPDLLAVMAYDAGRESERVRAGRPTDAVKLIETRLGYKPSLGYDFTMAREQVAHQVAGLRERHGLTQEQLANKIGCTVETIQRLEQSTADVTFEMLVRIAYACGERLQAEFQPVGEGPGE